LLVSTASAQAAYGIFCAGYFIESLRILSRKAKTLYARGWMAPQSHRGLMRRRPRLFGTDAISANRSANPIASARSPRSYRTDPGWTDRTDYVVRERRHAALPRSQQSHHRRTPQRVAKARFETGPRDPSGHFCILSTKSLKKTGTGFGSHQPLSRRVDGASSASRPVDPSGHTPI